VKPLVRDKLKFQAAAMVAEPLDNTCFSYQPSYNFKYDPSDLD
jgi:hypothetical protein